MKYLKNDLEVRVVKTDKELDEYLQFREDNDVWIEPYIKETSFIGVPNAPLLFADLKDDLEQKKVVPCDDDALTDVAQDTQLLAVFPKKDHYVAMPIRYTAMTSICNREQSFGNSVTDRVGTSVSDPMPIDTVAAWLTACSRIKKKKCKILIRDEKVGAMHSEVYMPLSSKACIKSLRKELNKEHPDNFLVEAQVSHEYLMVEWAMNDEVMEGSFKLLINKFGSDVKEVKAGVVFCTSDIATSSAYAYVFYNIDGRKVRLGDRLCVTHDDKNTVDNFDELMPKLGLLFKEAENEIENLGNIDLRFPENCLRNVATAKLKNTPYVTQEIINELAKEATLLSNATAVDIYLALSDIPNRVKRSLSPTQAITLSEAIAKCLFADYKKCDKATLD